jgi:hypothetical protein
LSTDFVALSIESAKHPAENMILPIGNMKDPFGSDSYPGGNKIYPQRYMRILLGKIVYLIGKLIYRIGNLLILIGNTANLIGFVILSVNEMPPVASKTRRKARATAPIVERSGHSSYVLVVSSFAVFFAALRLCVETVPLRSSLTQRREGAKKD